MNYEMKMPDLATTGSAIKILRWLKQTGQPVKRGEHLLEVETDKAVMEMESSVDGILRETRVGTGAEVAAGDLIAVLEVDAPAAPAARPAAATSPQSVPGTSPAPAAPVPGRPGLFARNRAAASGAAPGQPGTGKAPEALGPARRTAARRLQESKQTIPHFYLQASASAESLVARRDAVSPPKPAWDAFFVQAAGRALQRFDRMNFRFADDTLVPADTSSIGVAVDLEGDLFVVPVDAPTTKNVEQISREIRAGVELLRSGSPDARRIRPGVMTISNLGAAGVESFAAIINPPESAILAVGAIRPVVVPKGDTCAPEWRVSLTLSVDHRVVNGKYAADFLAAIVQEIETSRP
jgi:pyruvate dehydrogenase E2 component (dihydrolipoamide acetyltransferase)